MNAENLRIGDYVHIHFLKNTTTKQAKVENINIENNTIILVNQRKDIIKIDTEDKWEQIKPIPLDESVLKQFGYKDSIKTVYGLVNKNVYEKVYIFKDRSPILVTLIYEDGVFKLVQSDDEAFYGCKTKPSFQDLHIFQHYLSDNMYINNI